MNPTLRVLGLDAAFANCGMANANVYVTEPSNIHVEVTALDLITTTQNKVDKKVVRKNSDDLRRARELVEGIRRAISNEAIDLVIVEVPTGAQSARAAWTLGLVVGVLASIQVPIIEVTPREVKIAVGDKFAEKQEIIAWAAKKYPDLNWPRHAGKIAVGKAEHMADAIAVLHAGITTDEFGRMASIYRSMARRAGPHAEVTLQ